MDRKMRGKVGRAKTSQEYSFGTIMTSITYMLFKYPETWN